MKKYNNFDSHMVLLGIIIPFLVFFISMNTTFAYFTATAGEQKRTTTTATIQITFKDEEGINTVGHRIISSETGSAKLIPGDTLYVDGTLTNAGTADSYVVLEYTVNVKKQGSKFAESHHKKYYTFDGNALQEISGTQNNYTSLAGIVTAKTSKTFTLPEFKFDAKKYGNEYKNATVEYVVRANAIQTANITQAEATNQLMDNVGFNSTKVYGNSIQAATPSPTNPVEIQSVGERTKNLLDINGRSLGTLSSSGTNTSTRAFEFDKYYVGLTRNNYYYPERILSYSVSDGSVFTTSTSSGYGVGFPVQIKSNTQYVLFAEMADKIKSSLGVGFYTENGEYISDKVSKYIEGGFSFTTSTNCKILTVILMADASYSGVFNNIQLEEGSTATEYEPYGYKIPVHVETKNLISAYDLYAGAPDYQACVFENRNCVSFIDNQTYEYTGFTFKENTQYTVSFDVRTTIANTGNTNPSLAIRFFYTDGTMTQISVSQNMDWTHKTLTSSAGKTIQAVGLSSYNWTNRIYIDVDTFQFEEGSTATEYEPYIGTYNIYLDQPLRKVGDVADYLDLETGQVVRNVGEVIIDGSETYYDYTTQYENYYTAYTTNIKIGNTSDLADSKLLCDYFPNNLNLTSNFDLISSTKFALYIKISSSVVSNTSELKSWLSQNKPIILYQLDTPDTSETFGEAVSIPRGATVTINTTVAPSN